MPRLEWFFQIRKFDHTTPALIDLHWLPVTFRVQFKLLLFVYKCLHNQSPSSIKDVLSLKPAWGAGIAQWWEHSPSTNVAWVRFSYPASNVGWVCWFSTLHREVFSGNFGFPSPQKPKFEFDFIVLVVNFCTVSANKCSSARTTRHLNKVPFLFFPFSYQLCSSFVWKTSSVHSQGQLLYTWGSGLFPCCTCFMELAAINYRNK